MIRLLRRLGHFEKGTVTDWFDAAAEAAFVSDGTAERVEPEQPARPAAPDYSNMRKDDLLQLAMARGVAVSPRAKVREIVSALEESDADA